MDQAKKKPSLYVSYAFKNDVGADVSGWGSMFISEVSEIKTQRDVKDVLAIIRQHQQTNDVVIMFWKALDG